MFEEMVKQYWNRETDGHDDWIQDKINRNELIL